jgi:hypothetical protein
MPNGLLILAAFALYGLLVYGPRLIGRKRKIIGKPYKTWRDCPQRRSVSDTLREVNARRGK